MASVACTLIAERWLDEVIIRGTRANVDGDVADTFALPPGIGDLAIMSIMYVATGAATLVALTNIGVFAEVFGPNEAGTVDVVGYAPFLQRFTGQAGAVIDPDALTLWRQNEFVSIVHPELDSNAAPTIDYQFEAKCVRVRPMEMREQPSPIRLVR